MAEGYPEQDGQPVVDCRPLFVGAGDDPSAANCRAATLVQLRSALLARGYFYASMGSLLPAELIERVYLQSILAHSLPRGLKQEKYAGRKAPYRGFSDSEPSYDATTESTCHSWDFGRDVAVLPRSDPDYEYCGPNIYPDDELPDFRATIDELYDRQDRLAVVMFKALAEMFALPPDTFAEHFSWRSSSSLRLLRYPGQAATTVDARTTGGRRKQVTPKDGSPKKTGISPHTDYEMFTLMHQDAPGLQIVPMHGQGWIDLPVRPAEFVIIVGDMLERYTNGRLRATPHRVQLTPWPRNSIIRFTAVNGSTIVAPLPAFVTDGIEPLYTPVSQVQHVVSSLQAVYDGTGSWDANAPPQGRSLSASRVYKPGEYEELRKQYSAKVESAKL